MDEEKKTRRRGRRAYLDDFRRNVSGEYIYIGPLHAFRGTAESRKRGLIRWGLMAVGMAALGIVGGCIYAPGTTHCAYIMIPYVAGLLAAWSVLWAFARLAKGGDPLRGYVYDATVSQFRLRTMITAVGAGCAVAGELVYVALHGVQGMLPGMLLFLGSQGAMLALALLWRPLGREMVWELRENPDR